MNSFDDDREPRRSPPSAPEVLLRQQGWQGEPPLFIVRLVSSDVEPPEEQEQVGLARVPCRDETVQWRDREWFVADVISDLDAGEITVVLRTHDQA